MTSRVCDKTGLALVSSPATVFRVAKQSYGPLAPMPRFSASDVNTWSRYDTVGRTLYAADTKLTAYMELLAPYRTEIAKQRRALQPVADFMGRDLDELWKQIVSEWDERGNMKATWLPRSFREGRGLYTLRLPKGWWVDIIALETISALHDLFGAEWPSSNGTISEPLTLSHLTSDDRALTTAIASKLRGSIELDDGTLPLGIRFESKHGHPAGRSGTCWAYWMRDVDSGFAEPARVSAGSAILDTDAVLRKAQLHCKIKVR